MFVAAVSDLERGLHNLQSTQSNIALMATHAYIYIHIVKQLSPT